MQEDKEGCFDSLQSLSLCVAATAGMVRDMTPRVERMKAAAGLGYSTATDLADWLVRALGLPFRQAHHVTGQIVAVAAEAGLELEQLTLAQLQAIEPAIGNEVFEALGVENSVRSRTSYGGAAPDNVRLQARAWAQKLAGEKPE
jgi:argininosuccinate lyase